ncbi:MAG TPA: sigma-54 dependent transcriptional regulator [Bryobacteraceae bacterium]|jgi:DNA-binding NtrC family response regulator|nr:sigma-54 dependent transcriptional regulator [Bryobacteraceae bacterium]
MATVVETPTAIKTKARILIVDDELVVRDSLGKWFTSEGYAAYPTGSAREALETIQHQEFDIALIDIKMPGMDGMELQARLKEADPELAVIVMTGYASVETAVQALKRGAYEYITKPVDPDELSHLVANALEHQRTRREVVRLREDLQEAAPGTELIGRSPAMKKVQELIEMVASTDATVLLTGESGTGKEVVARAIHASGPRRYMPLVTIHCGALTETLLESELFGHEKGAFTGAQYRKKGKFEAADGGTVFLDEISDISLKTQTDLLRVLQEHEIVRVGGTQPIKVDFRCVAATNKNLEALVKAGSFRPDLYYRLHVFCIDLPPLRDRREDIPLLVSHFLNKFCLATSRPVPQISAEALDLLTRHDWPGNVRELENAVERALVVGHGPEIRASDFSFQFEAQAPSMGRTLDDVERAHIERILRETQHNMSRAARILDIDRTTLYNKIRRYGMR